MKKIGLITWHSHENYGSALQTYALKTVLEEKGYNVEVINYVKDAKKDLLHITYRKLKKIYKGKNNSYNRRTYLFLNFRKRYLNETKLYTSSNELEMCNYDIYICGSDQIWSASRFDESYFLNFVDNKLKIAYAPSMVITNFNNENKKKLIKLLSDFSAISVREPIGSKYIENIINKNVPVVLDPTLLLNKKDYEKILVEPKIKEPYLLCYLIGDRIEHRNLVKKIANKKNLKIVTLPFKSTDENLGDIILKGVGPSEFLGLVNNASIICTDSYHGMLLSIIFEKEFYEFQRFNKNDKNSQNARVENIIKLFKLEKRLISSLDDLDNKKIDYEKINKIKSKKQKESFEYLDSALKGEKHGRY